MTNLARRNLWFLPFFINLYFFSSSTLNAGPDTGLQTSIALDIVADTAIGDGSSGSDKAIIRGAEVMFYGPIDHIFDGTVGMAAHPEEGVSLFELHEAYIGSSKLIPRSRFRFGQFFLGVGRFKSVSPT